jgi:hypothetical protein
MKRRRSSMSMKVPKPYRTLKLWASYREHWESNWVVHIKASHWADLKSRPFLFCCLVFNSLHYIKNARVCLILIWIWFRNKYTKVLKEYKKINYKQVIHRRILIVLNTLKSPSNNIKLWKNKFMRSRAKKFF